MSPTTDTVTDLNFEKFTESDYKFNNYQVLKEIGFTEALNTKLVEQENWIEKYLKDNKYSM
jgi:hypothetical protein